ncbi:MAG: putative metal-binding motif-containing protein [Polyangiaceae bacterium]|nr:putative metal-binding motif-containing protein [Polyangiaceae bacterium]
MEQFLDCGSCQGFVPHDADTCPHCGNSVVAPAPQKQSRKGLLGAMATVATGGLMSITLMACYGIAYTCDGGVDKDGDGFYLTNDANCESDCNDNDPNIHPFADDPLGDGIDQNCDGQDGGGGGGSGGGGAGGTTG